MTYKIYRHLKSSHADNVVALLRDNGVSPSSCHNVILEDCVCTTDDIQSLLDMLGMWAIDLVDRDDVVWVDSHLNEESDDAEIIDFIADHPYVMKSPIVVKGENRALYCDFPERAIELF